MLMREAYKAAGARGFWQKRLEVIEQRRSQGANVSLMEIAEIHTKLGDKDQAFAWLEKAFEARETDVLHLKVDPALDDLRSDPRYTALLRRMNLAP